MNIHEYQAKEILKGFGAPVAAGVAITDPAQVKLLSMPCPDPSGWSKARSMPVVAARKA